MDESDPNLPAQLKPKRLLWYCAKCTRMIHPPGAEGMISSDGQHYCTNCAPSDSAIGPAIEALPKRSAVITGLAELQRKRAASMQQKRPLSLTLAAGGAAVAALVLIAVVALGQSGDTPSTTQPIAKVQTDPEPPQAVATTPPQHVQTPKPIPPPLLAHETRSIEELHKTDLNAADPALPANSVGADPTPQPAATEKIDQTEILAAGLKQSDELVKEMKFKAALDALAKLKKKHVWTPWWKGKAEQFNSAVKAVEKEAETFAQQARTAAEGAAKAETVEQLREIETLWETRSAIPDELASLPARSVLQAVSETRRKFANAAREKSTVEISTRMEAIEKQLKARPRTFDGILKELAELEPRILADGELAAKFLEQHATLQFDAQLARDGDVGMCFKVSPKVMGPLVELNYDFSTAEQFSAWTFDNPEKKSGDSVELDKIKSGAHFNIRGDHGWDGYDRKGLPFLRLPFAFRADVWYLEADASILSTQKNRCDIGIVVWDGGKNALRFIARDKEKGDDIFVQGGGSSDARDKFLTKSGSLPGRVKERTRLVMVCDKGTVTLNAMTANKSVAVDKVQLGFEPKYIGLFLRTNDQHEQATAVFTSVKIKGIPNKETVTEMSAAARLAALTAARAEVKRLSAGKEWRPDWRYDSGGKTEPASVTFAGRENVWRTQPGDFTTPSKWIRKVKLDPNKKHYLQFNVASDEAGQWLLTVRASGRELLKEKPVSGGKWESFEINLSEFAGKEVTLELWNKNGGAQPSASGYWDKVQINSQ